MNDIDVRLTSLAHGGGCGCKLAPSVLQQILADMPLAGPFANLLVGTETGDDAAVYRLNDTQALVATTDFFMPVVDDPEMFGRIAATNALSDIYAMGGNADHGARPCRHAPRENQHRGGAPHRRRRYAATCAEAGIPVAGGHSIDSPEPIYGLVALGLVHPDRLMRNSSARTGDRLILTKGLGIGIYSAALKQGRLEADGYDAMIASATQLNDVGIGTGHGMPGVHAMTDITGFGLLGHALELCRGSGLAATLRIDGRAAAARRRQGWRGTGSGPGRGRATGRAMGTTSASQPDVEDWQKDVLCDPQTSGGLLLAVAARCGGRGAGAAARAELPVRAGVIGEVAAGSPSITVA